METLLFFLAIFFYFVIGRIVALILTHFGKLNSDSTDYFFEALMCTVFFPIVLFCLLVSITAKAIFRVFAKKNDYDYDSERNEYGK